jgi:hypothetical protein
MPFHLELGSDGHSFNGKAIVVDSKSGRHLTAKPITYDKAVHQKEVVEEAVKKYGEPVTAKGLPDMRGRKKKAPAPKVTRTPIPPAQAKALLAQLAERKKARELKHIEPKLSALKEKVVYDEDKSILPVKAKAKPAEKIGRVAYETKGHGKGSYQGGFTERYVASETEIAKRFNISKNKNKPTHLSLRDTVTVVGTGLAVGRAITQYLFGLIPDYPSVYFTGKKIHRTATPYAEDPPRPLRSTKMKPVEEKEMYKNDPELYKSDIESGYIKKGQLWPDYMSDEEFLHKVESGEITKDNYKTAVLWAKK